MLQDYPDIRSRIAKEPTWFDNNGTPRYRDFHPSLMPDIYADECLLYEIECQGCGLKYLVAESWCKHLNGWRGDDPVAPLSMRVRRKSIHFGDPPCFTCASGATMNCIDIKTVQFWRRERAGEWRRVLELEGVPLE